MVHRSSLLVVVGLAACINEPPGLPGVFAEGSTGPEASTNDPPDDGATSSDPTQGETSADSGSDGVNEPGPACGDGVLAPTEECDGADLQAETCESLGFLGGGLTCADDCTFDTSACDSCGDSVVDPGEPCDGDDLDGQSCESLGFTGVGLACNDCRFDTSACGPMTGMLEVPQGEFTMGSPQGAFGANEAPQRMVQLERFWIDATEVTVAHYAACVADGACTEPDAGGDCNWMVTGRDAHPINCVDWAQADEYCAWAGDGTKRLPTEAEWEKAARGTDGRLFPWGDSPNASCTHVVKQDGNDPGGCGSGSTMEVGSKPLGVSTYGAHDMSGNVYEWVADWYGSYDPQKTVDPTGPDTGSTRVARGAAWVNGASVNFRASRRIDYAPDTRLSRLGFRCARTPPIAR